MEIYAFDLKELDEKRKQLGLSMAELSLRCGVQQRTVERFFHGDVVPRKANLERIIAALEGKPVPVKSSDLSNLCRDDVPPIAKIVTLFLGLREEDQVKLVSALRNLLPAGKVAS